MILLVLSSFLSTSRFSFPLFSSCFLCFLYVLVSVSFSFSVPGSLFFSLLYACYSCSYYKVRLIFLKHCENLSFHNPMLGRSTRYCSCVFITNLVYVLQVALVCFLLTLNMLMADGILYCRNLNLMESNLGGICHI